MRLFWVSVTVVLASACGGLHSGKTLLSDPDRQIASVAVERLLNEEASTFDAEIDEKLFSLHSYYVITQKHLEAFDNSLKDSTIESLYHGQHYLSLLAVRTQIDEIEKELLEIHQSLDSKTRVKSFLEQIKNFSQKGKLNSLSVQNLHFLLKIPLEASKQVEVSEIEREYRELEKMKEFQIFEKNIQHISHLMELNLTSNAETWRPDESQGGSLSGQEFPGKVWALTFSNGPNENATRQIVEALKARNMKGTFFQESKKTESLNSVAPMVAREGMEIGIQSGKELSKAGTLTLEREITFATQALENKLALDVKFYRLPYASGIEVPVIRQMIAKNKLIHVFWNIDSLDWPPQTADRIVERTKKLMKKTPRNAGVILFHDTHPRSVEASTKIMDHLKLDARRVCTLGTIIKDMNKGQKTVCSNN